MDVAPKAVLMNVGLFVLLAVAVLTVNIDDVAADPVAWLAVAAVTAVIGVVAIDLAWWINVRFASRLTPIQAALEALAVGFVFGATQALTASVIGLELVRGVVLTVVSVTISAGAFGVLAILIGQARRAEAERMQLLYEQGAVMEAARQDTSAIIRGLHIALASDIDAALSPARLVIESRLADQERLVTTENWSHVAEELRNTAWATVRPLSRRLWAYAPARIHGPGFGRILRTIITEQPFQPLVLILIYWATTFGGTIAAMGWIGGSFAVLIGTGLIAVILGGANAVMRRYPRHHAQVFIGAALLLQVTGLLTFVVRDAWSAAPYSWAEYVLSVLGGIVLILVTSGFGSIRTYRMDLARTFRADIDDELRTSMAASVRVAQLARESAQILHGSIQTRLVACAVAIERASQTGDVDAFRAAMHEAHDALTSPALGLEDTRPLGEQLARTVSLWSGLCSVNVNIDPRLSEVRGELARNVGRVVEEAVNNSVSHGDASIIYVSVCDSRGAVRIEVTDNGSGIEHHTPGMGSALFSSLCMQWEWVPIEHGILFSAQIAMN